MSKTSTNPVTAGETEEEVKYEQKVLDDIDEEISFAYGIEAAIEGIDLDCTAVKWGVQRLQRTHIENLERLRARVLKLNV
jgi:hypothetical protein